MSQDSKKTAAKAAEEKAKAAPTTESEAQPDVQEKQVQERKTTVETVPETERNQAPEKLSAAKVPVMKTVSAWSAERRLASWQLAALLRAKGWEGDKQVSETEFNQALAAAMSRAQGGGYGRRN